MKQVLFFVVILFVFALMKSVWNIYPDFLWFSSFNYADVWKQIFLYKWGAVLAVFTFSIAWFFLNVKVIFKNIQQAKNNTDTFSFTGFLAPLSLFLTYIRSSLAARPVTPLSKPTVYVVIALFSGILAGKWFGHWKLIPTFFGQSPVGILDPIFSKDISFYLFTFPVLQVLHAWLYSLVTFALTGSIWFYVIRGAIFEAFSFRSHSRIRVHLLALLFCWLVLLGWDKFLDAYSLLYLDRGTVSGVGYVEHKILIPLYKILASALFIQSGLLLLWVRFRTIVPLYGVVVALILFLITGILPPIVQAYIVAPNEFERERLYIDYSLDFTRSAYGLSNVQEKFFPVKQNLTYEDFKKNKGILDNVKLWNEEPIRQTFSQLQEIRLYYEFGEVDVDRYEVDGRKRQVMLSAREIDVKQLTEQAKTWVNERLIYTHGYGLCMAPVNRVGPNGLPEFLIKDIPPQSTFSLKVKRPEIYFGEKTTDYVILNTKQKEFDYPQGDDNVYTHYQGKGGVQLSSLFRRLIYAFTLSDIKILISSLIHDESRLLYDRDIFSIVKTLTPFISYDPDPYLVLTEEGRMVWVLDGYTSSKWYPYSEKYGDDSVKLNYVRNSVKATVDAYSGETHFYVSDLDDPIIQSFDKAFVGLFKPLSDLSSYMRSHIRYPKSLFAIQADIFMTYHMKDAQVFYNKEDLWSFPKEKYGEVETVMQPYYMMTRLPEEEEERFILMLPFTPSHKNNMIAWMSVSCDPDSYGQFQLYKFPKEKTVYGPMQIESRIDQDTEISKDLTLWGQVGSRVIRGNLVVLPIEESLVYIEPIYLQATQSRLPEMKRVIFVYQGKVVMKDSLESAIASHLGYSSSLNRNGKSSEFMKGKGESSEKTIYEKFKKVYFRMKESLKASDWIQFGEHMNALDKLLKDR